MSPSTEPMSEAKRKINVLIVDDESENLQVLDATLRDLDLKVMKAVSGRQALKYLLIEEFALIIMDVDMPELDGFETARLIRQRGKEPHVPIIFLTSSPLREVNATRAYELGAVDFMAKPYNPQILRARVSVFVDLFKNTEKVLLQAQRLREMEQREFEVRLQETWQRLEAEQFRMREEHRVSQAIVEHAPLGFARLDSDLTILEANGVIGQFSGTEPAMLVGRKLDEVFPWLPQQPFHDALREGKQYLAQELEIAPFCHVPLRQDESKESRYCDVAVWPIKSEDEQLMGAILLVLDVSERVRLAQQRQDFVATLAHDLQTPVVASDRALELLLGSTKHPLDPDQKKIVTMIRENNRGLLELIQSLLDIYRYEEGAPVLYFDALQIEHTLHSCIQDLTPLADRQGVNISCRFARDLLPVWADSTALRRVINNLLDNAIKFSPRGETVEVTARNTAGGVELAVANRGPAISPDEMALVFARYWHKPARRGYKTSCGLGLYLCKQIVDAHRGEITCQSDPERGTIMTVILPTEPTTDEVDAPHPMTTESKDKKHHTVRSLQ